ncbi:mechanosensitive ion channel family protein [Sphingosinicella sp. CPCC 101087]|uniref:mechanosensitive ion channel family protein n=1 Tax=Sphingosinicella sp. CPCC 101087 TaxID=2497754 RepID=UPI001FB10EC5|nr:mechanosensitive ion channel domain-containing protein [Sphingosinicella sp. CPCC 101087]
MTSLAADLGIVLPEAPDLIALAMAASVIAAALLFGWAAGKWAGPKLVHLFERKSGAPAEGLVPRLCAVLRYLIVWLTASIALGIHDWPPLPTFLLGLTAALSAALAVRQIGRGLNLLRWVALLLSAFLFVAILAGSVGGLDPIASALDHVAFTIGRRRLSLLVIVQLAFAILAIYVLVRLAIRLVGHLIQGAGSLDPTQRLLTQKLAAIAIITLAFFVGIDLVGIDLTALAVFSGALGLAVGFGLQKTIGNLIAGIILLMDRSIKPGDVISVGETFGSVSKIGVRAVSIVTREGKEYLIPNEILMTEEVVNWSYSTRDVRISIPVSVAYDCDVKLAQRLMIEAAMAASRVLESPKPVAWMTGFGDNSIEHEIRVWIRDPEAGLGNVRSDILNRVWESFQKNGVSVPFPQRDIRVKEWPVPAPPAEPADAARIGKDQ